jgi:hypothetical protein
MPEVDSSQTDSIPNIEPKKNNVSKLLIHENPLQILPSLAVLIGLNEAIILQQIHYWISNELNKNIVNGRKWVYNTYEEWKSQFPFWSRNTIIRTIEALEYKKLVISGEFNKLSRDRTKWYTIDYERLGSLDIGKSKNSGSHLPKMGSCIYPNLPDGATQNGYMGLPKMGSSNTRDYLPEITKEHNVRFSNFEKEFQEFWNCYEKKEDRKKCEKAYAKLLKDKGVNLHEKIMNAISAQKKSRDLAESFGIWQPARKNPLTWLNGNCWEDEVKTQEKLNAERNRIVGNLSKKPGRKSTADEYHNLNARVREAADREISRINEKLRAEFGEDAVTDDEAGIEDF